MGPRAICTSTEPLSPSAAPPAPSLNSAWPVCRATHPKAVVQLEVHKLQQALVELQEGQHDLPTTEGCQARRWAACGASLSRTVPAAAEAAAAAAAGHVVVQGARHSRVRAAAAARQRFRAAAAAGGHALRARERCLSSGTWGAPPASRRGGGGGRRSKGIPQTHSKHGQLPGGSGAAGSPALPSCHLTHLVVHIRGQHLG